MYVRVAALSCHCLISMFRIRSTWKMMLKLKQGKKTNPNHTYRRRGEG